MKRMDSLPFARFSLAASLLLCISIQVAGELANERIQSLVQLLYPKARWIQTNIANYGSKERCLFPIPRDGLIGFLPLRGIHALSIDSETVLVGMEMFLVQSDDTDANTICSVHPEDGIFKVKILQVVGFDSAKKRFLFKMPGYPIIDSSWTCMGDICSVPALVTLKSTTADGRRHLIQVMYSRGFNTFSEWFTLGNSGAPQQVLPAQLIGDLSGQSGCDVSIRQEHSVADRNMTVSTIRVCSGDDCREICKQFEMPFGTDTSKLIVQ